MSFSSRSLPPNVLRCLPVADRRRLGKAGLLPEEALAKEEVRAERDLQRLVANLLRLRGIPFNASRMDRRTTCVSGWPDFTLVTKGVPMAWEVKTKKGQLTPQQERLHILMQACGWRVSVIRSIREAIVALEAAA